MTDSEKPVKEGYLWLPPKSSFLLVSKPWQRKFCRLYRSSKQGIERLEIFENEDDPKNSAVPILTLENCIKICEDVQKNQAHVFVVITKTNTHHFSSNSQDDMIDWISAFQAVAFRDNASRQTIEEDNDLYCSSGDSGIFSVKLVSSEASERCGLETGPYTLTVTSSALQLHRIGDSQVLVTWPYRFIRKYGYSSGKLFTFEAGRKCSTGEGFFKFEHSHQQEIFRCISSKMRHMKKLLFSEGGREGAILCGDTQFQAALAMMARSRSPLPPSPTGSTPLDSEFSSLGSFKPLVSCDNSPTGGERLFPGSTHGMDKVSLASSGFTSHISLLEKHASEVRFPRRCGSQERTLSRERSRSTDRSLSLDRSERPMTLSLPPPPTPAPPPPTERPPPPPPKPKLATKPEKPPRKSLPTLKLELPLPTSPSGMGAAYDDVEMRSDAWRTLGLTNAPHSERPYVVPRPSESTRSPADTQKIFAARTPETQKIFVATSAFHMNDYDTLQHLGTTSKVGPSLTLARSRSAETLDDVIDTKTEKLMCSAKV
ncbi:hypothetical protein M8J76_016505 [Diaphorina citri]|nr:hypothetical protein M8J76_016505 [Diaphorina citri]